MRLWSDAVWERQRGRRGGGAVAKFMRLWSKRSVLHRLVLAVLGALGEKNARIAPFFFGEKRGPLQRRMTFAFHALETSGTAASRWKGVQGETRRTKRSLRRALLAFVPCLPVPGWGSRGFSRCCWQQMVSMRRWTRSGCVSFQFSPSLVFCGALARRMSPALWVVLDATGT